MSKSFTKRANHVTPARVAALKSLELYDENRGYIRDLITKVIRTSQMSAEDNSFAMVLSIGVISYRGTLDELINSVLKHSNDIKNNIRRALQISVYELYFLNKDPHAAVDQGVELARYINPRAAGVANFVLRRLSEKREEFPFGDPSADDRALARFHGFPQWLAKCFIEDLGRDAASKVMKQSNCVSQLYFMVNTLRAHGPQVIEALVSRGYSIASVPFSKDTLHFFPTFVAKDRNLVGDSLFASLLKEDALVVSDWAAQEVVRRSLPSVCPSSMIEIGSGRGTKTVMFQVAAQNRYGKQIKLSCLDVSTSRLRELKNRVSRARVCVESVIQENAAHSKTLEDSSYDVVFIDAPCSGTGTLDKHPEIKWNVSSQEVSTLVGAQKSILVSASKAVSSGGRLVYATCSALKQENECVVEDFLQSEDGKAFSILPIGDNGEDFFYSLDSEFLCDVHFCAVLSKN